MMRVFPGGMPVNVALTTPAEMIAKVKAAVDPVIAAGLLPFYSFKFVGEPAILTLGKADGHLAALHEYNKSLPVGSCWTWHHEDDGTGISGSSFAQAWTYVDDRVSGVLGVHGGPVFEGYMWRAKKFDQQYVPPSGNYDFLGVDVYTSDWDASQGGLRGHTQFQDFLKGIPATAKVFVVERGVTTGVGSTPKGPDDQAAEITDDYAYLKTLGDRAYGYLYWDSTGATDTSVFALDGAGKKALAAAASDANPVVDGRVYAPAKMTACAQCHCIIDADQVNSHYDDLHAEL